jgi:hypothetical protein
MELMRSFRSFTSRRRIKDAKSWFITIGINTQEQFLEWCKHENIEPPSEDIFVLTQKPAPATSPVAKPAPKMPATKKSSARKKSKKKDTTWVPAAERSRIVKGKKPAALPSTDKVIEEEDEEHSEHTKTSNP